MEIRTGTTLAGRYRVGPLLGGGGHALVYRGRHLEAGRDVAIKVLRASIARQPLMRERFSREARAANRIRHPNVVDVTDVGEAEDGAPFLVMELIEGAPLTAQLGQAWPEERVRWLGAEVARALAAGHALGVVHRDLTPDNVLLGDADRLKVVDFGLAKVDGERRLTASSVTVGTPRYMAPEQVGGEAVSDRTDVYALACILFEASSGRPPFIGSGPDVMAAHLRDPVPSLPRGTSPPLAELVRAGLCKVAADRPTAAAMVAALSGGPAPALRDRPAPSAADRLHQRRALVERLLAHIHPEGDVPDTIASGLGRVRRASEALRAGSEPVRPSSAEAQATVAAQIERMMPGEIQTIDGTLARALVELGRLAERWLSLDELRCRELDPDAPLSVADADAVIDAIEAYIESHPDGASLLPRRTSEGAP